MELIIITILILSYLVFRDYTYQKEMKSFFSLIVSDDKDIKQDKNKVSLLKKVFVKNEKNDLKEINNPYVPLEEVPEETIKENFEGILKKL